MGSSGESARAEPARETTSATIIRGFAMAQYGMAPRGAARVFEPSRGFPKGPRAFFLYSNGEPARGEARQLRAAFQKPVVGAAQDREPRAAAGQRGVAPRDRDGDRGVLVA